jgi:hypothetical protein
MMMKRSRSYILRKTVKLNESYPLELVEYTMTYEIIHHRLNLHSPGTGYSPLLLQSVEGTTKMQKLSIKNIKMVKRSENKV